MTYTIGSPPQYGPLPLYGPAQSPPQASNPYAGIADNFRNMVSNFGSNMGRLDPRLAGGAAKAAVGDAVAGARSAYGGVKKLIPAAGGVMAVVGGGLEAKARMDRGEDGWRAAGGGLANTLGSGLAGAAGFSVAGPLGAMIAAPIGGAAAGWINDRATDAFRGNDGKGTDAIVADLDGQIQQAVNRGDNNRAMELAQKKQQVTAARQNANASPYQQGNRADASSYGVGPDGMAQFNEMKNQVGSSEYATGQAFNGNLDRDQRLFNQGFGQRKLVDVWGDDLAAKVAQRTAGIARTNQWNTAQTDIARNQPQMMQNAVDSALRYAVQAGQGGIR